MKKVLLFLAAILILLCVSFAVLLTKAYFFPAPAECPANAALIPEAVAPGEAAEYSFDLTLPLWDRIGNVSVKGENITASQAQIKLKKWQFDRNIWQVSGTIRKLVIESTPGAEIEISAGNTKGDERKNFTVRLPELPEKSPETLTGEKLILAGIPSSDNTADNVPLYKKWWIYAAGAVILFAIAGGIILQRFIKKQFEENIPFDEAIIREIRRINEDVQHLRCQPANGFAGICDCMRNYLEQRFDLPATRQTTGEFLHNLSIAENILTPEEKRFLAGFMNHADIIKFAAGQADKDMIAQAAEQAENMIRQTSAGESQI